MSVFCYIRIVCHRRCGLTTVAMNECCIVLYCVRVRCYDATFRVNGISGVCEPVPDCSVDHCYHGDCVVVADSFVCNCYDGWTSVYCNVSGPVTGTQTASDSDVHIAAIIVPVIIGILLLREFGFH